MKYILDTNICIYIIKRKPLQVIEKFKTLSIGDVCISSITLAELQYGVNKSSKPVQNYDALNRFLIPIDILDFGVAASVEYGKIRANLEARGKVIGPMDMMIAAHTKSLELTLVTNNIKEFNKIEGLILENWV